MNIQLLINSGAITVCPIVGLFERILIWLRDLDDA